MVLSGWFCGGVILWEVVLGVGGFVGGGFVRSGLVVDEVNLKGSGINEWMDGLDGYRRIALMYE